MSETSREYLAFTTRRKRIHIPPVPYGIVIALEVLHQGISHIPERPKNVSNLRNTDLHQNERRVTTHGQGRPGTTRCWRKIQLRQMCLQSVKYKVRGSCLRFRSPESWRRQNPSYWKGWRATKQDRPSTTLVHGHFYVQTSQSPNVSVRFYCLFFP